MTKKLTATEAMMRRAISAARKEGLRVVGIRPTDGTVLVDEGVARDSLIAHTGVTFPARAAIDYDDIEA